MTRPFLQLFDKALADHARNESGELRVITIVAPDVTREPNLPLVRQITTHAGGILFDAATNWRGVVGRGDAVLEQVLTTIEVPLAIELRREEELVFARHRDGPEPGTNEAARVFLGLVNTLLDRRMLEADLAVIVYDEAELDVDRAQAAWDLVTAQLRGLQLGRVRTLIVLVGAASINYRRHCARDRGLRFAVQGTELLERREWRNDLADIGRLAESEEPLVLFLAAGASASSGMPVGDTMRDEAIRGLLHFDGPAEELAGRFYDYARDTGQLLPGEEGISPSTFARGLTLERVLFLEQQSVPGNQFGPTMLDFANRHAVALQRRGAAVRAVQKMAALRKHLILVTVNLDELVEEDHDDDIAVFATDADFASCADYIATYLENGGRVPLLKIHGTVSKPETVVVSVDRVARGLTDEQISALELLRGKPDRPRTWIYVGSSMRDRDLTQLLGLPRFANELDEWWVTPFRIPTVDAFINEHRSQPWKEAKRFSTPVERTITETADVFLDEFAELWTAKNE